jgi:hypothetical protein
MSQLHAEPAETQSNLAQAKRFFLGEVVRIPGVVEVVASGGDTLAGQAFTVYIRPGDLQAERSVYELEGRTYDRFEDGLLEVHLAELPAATEPSPSGT